MVLCMSRSEADTKENGIYSAIGTFVWFVMVDWVKVKQTNDFSADVDNALVFIETRAYKMNRCFKLHLRKWM